MILILFWLGWHLVVPADLIGTDLGRHIKNGELILQGNWDVLYKNYYSYANPEYPFINHNWLFGILSYVLWHAFGFTILSFIYLIFQLFIFYVFFRCWQRYSTFPIACAIALLSIPLISWRREIRPEGVTYLFCGLFWWLIDHFQQKRLKAHSLIIVLCVLQIIWVNAHFFFLMGPILTALFWLQARINKESDQADVLQKLFFLLLVMCLVNPSGINGFLAPFRLDRSYFDFPTSENYSVFYLIKGNIFKPLMLYFCVTLGMLWTALLFLIKREGFKKYVLVFSLTLIVSLAAMKANRLIGLFGYFWIPLSTYACSRWIEAESAKFRRNFEIALLVLGIVVSASVNFNWNQNHSLVYDPEADKAAEFLKSEKMGGVIYNNSDIGSYLIFHLSPQHKVFIDSRPEAYPKDFLKKTYLRMQWNDALWHELEPKYHFNVIFFTPEQTPWGYKFMVDRFQDRSWAVVYLSDKAIIFLKRNAQNADIIRRDEIFFKVNIRLSMPKNIPFLDD